SQLRVTWQMDWEEPRSTSSHCGSEKALDQRVPVLPSTAAEAGVPAFSADDAVTGLPCDSSTSAAAAGPATRNDASKAMRARNVPDRMRLPGRRDTCTVLLLTTG